MNIEWMIPLTNGLVIMLGCAILLLGVTWLFLELTFRVFEKILRQRKIYELFVEFGRERSRRKTVKPSMNKDFE